MGGRRRRGRQASPSGAQSGMAVRLVHGAIVDTDDSHLTRHESRSTDSHLTSLAPPVDTCPGGARPLDPRHSAQNKYDSGNEWVKYSVSCRDTLRYSRVVAQSIVHNGMHDLSHDLRGSRHAASSYSNKSKCQIRAELQTGNIRENETQNYGSRVSNLSHSRVS